MIKLKRNLILLSHIHTKNPGNYNVILNVFSDNGCSNNLVKDIDIYELPIVKFNENNCVNETIKFYDASSSKNGIITSWWNFNEVDNNFMKKMFLISL